jgi:hypothetical protein
MRGHTLSYDRRHGLEPVDRSKPMGAAAHDVAVLRGLALACRCAAKAPSGTGCTAELVSLLP